MTWQIDYRGSWQSRVWLEPELCFIVHPRKWLGETEQKRGRGKANREGDSLHSYRTLQGLEQASSPSRWFAPREIQSRMNFFQRSVISWEKEREAGREKDRDRGQIRTPPYTKVTWIMSNLTKPAALYCHCRFSMQNLSQSHASGPQSQGLLTKAAGGGCSSLPHFLIRCEGTRPVGGSERNTHILRWFQTAPLHHNTNGCVSSGTVD